MRQIGRYQIRNELGRGGMAIVYRAHDPRFEREVAIKLLPRQFTHDPEFLSRFQAEAKIIAALEHPAIVPVYDYGEHEDAPYLVMRFMAGGSLQDRLNGRPMPIAEISTIYDRLALALDKAHKRGIIHRDLKPDNVFFDEDNRAFLGDFGIARMAEATQTMTIIGTPAYMSPEQAQGNQKLDWRCDIYALGVMLYQLFTGRQPYEAETPTGQMLMHVLQPVPDVLAANPELPPEAQNIINKSMAKERAFRYSTTAALAEDIKLLLPGNNGVAAAAAGAAVAGAATVVESPPMATAVEPAPMAATVESPQMATVVESASYQPPVAATVVETGPQPGQTAVPTVPRQPAAPPRASKGGSGKTFAIIGVVVILLLAALGTGYYFVSGGGGGEAETAAASSAAELERVPVIAPAASPTASPVPTDSPTATSEVDAGVMPADSQELDNDGDGLVGADDECPDDPGTVETGGCPAAESPAPTTAAAATTALKRQQVFNFDLPSEVGALLSEATVIYHDDFTELSPAVWREAADYQAVDGLLELTDTQACLGRLEGLAPNSAMLVHFSYEDVPNSDFEMFINNGILGSANYRQWGTRMNGDTPAVQVMRKRSLIEDAPLEGDLSLEPGAWYQLLLAVDQDADFVAQLWSSDDPAIVSEYRQTLEEWADQEWYGAFCNARGDVFVESYTEIAFDDLLPPVVAEAPETDGSSGQSSGSQPASSSNQTGAASQGSGLPMGFESFGTWRRGNQDNGSFTQSGEQAHSGGSSGKLSYDFPSTDNDYVVFLQLNDIPGSPDTLAAWVYGDGVGHYLNAWIVDSDGQTWQVPLGNVTHSGWKQMSGRIETGQDWPWTHISGTDNGQVDYPITFRAFVLDDYSAGYSGSGEIFIDDLSATTLGGASAGGTSVENTPAATAVAGATAVVVGTPEAGATPEVEGSPTPEELAFGSSGELEFTYAIEWRLDPEDDARAIASVSIWPKGGGGDYEYFQDEEPRPGSEFEFEWRACKAYPGSFRVNSGDGQLARRDVWEKAPCPDEPSS